MLSTKFFLPISSPSGPAARLPRTPADVSTAGHPESAAALMFVVRLSPQKSQFSLLFQPRTKRWLLAMAQVRPYFLRTGQSVTGHNSTDFRPSAAAWRASSSVAIGLKHH